MDYDSFLSSQRWNILEIISKRPSSPVEIASKLGTSVSYVSQQLKLLEAGGIVKKQKTGVADKGQPRNLFLLAKEFMHITALIGGSPLKKIINLDDYHKSVLRIWSIEDYKKHYPIQRFLWLLEDDLLDIDAIYFNNNKNKLLIYSESKKIRHKIEQILKGKDIEFEFFSGNNLNKELMGESVLLYPVEFYPRKEMKGGRNL